MTNVKLPAGQWVDLYASTGIAVGTQITALNITSNDLRLAATASEPNGTTDHIPVQLGRGIAINDANDPGAWGMCIAGGAVDIKEA